MALHLGEGVAPPGVVDSLALLHGDWVAPLLIPLPVHHVLDGLADGELLNALVPLVALEQTLQLLEFVILFSSGWTLEF